MYDAPRFTDDEWNLIVELLECELNELPSEMHHTDNADVRAELQQRANMTRQLLDRLQEKVAV
jgi:hypothetical protein